MRRMNQYHTKEFQPRFIGAFIFWDINPIEVLQTKEETEDLFGLYIAGGEL